MNKQEQRIIDAARKVLDNWLCGEVTADVSGDFGELESAIKSYEKPSPIDFDWKSFRAEAAKDILCAMIARGEKAKPIVVDIAIDGADELIKQLKKKEEK